MGRQALHRVTAGGHGGLHDGCVPARPSLTEVLTAAVAGAATPQEVLDALLHSTVFCEAPDAPGLMTADTPAGPVAVAFCSLAALSAARGAVSWFSTSGQDLLGLLPAGHDLLLLPETGDAVRLRTSALRPVVEVR